MSTATVSTPDTRTTPVARAVDPRRVRRTPHAAVGALVVAASATRLAATLTGDEYQVAAWTAGCAFVIAVVAATRARRRVFDKQALRRVYAFCAVAVGWLTTVTVTGLTVGAVGVLMALGYGLSLHWWRTHPVGWLQEQTTPDRYTELWGRYVGGDGGVLAGSVLFGEETIASGVRYGVRLIPGKQSLETVEAALSKIRGGLGLYRHQQLIVEPHPTEPEPAVLLTIVTNSPILQSVLHPGASAFDPRTGRVRLGPFADGEGVATWKAYTDNRFWGGYLQGGTGSGKSRMIESIALPLADSDTHPTVIVYGDGQGGASSPLLMKHADVGARTHDQILAMFEGLVLVILLRQDENALSGAEGFTPTADRPGILAVLDECHKPLSKQENPTGWARLQYLIATVAREGGKVGVAALLASQQTTLDVFGGAQTPNSEAIRTNLLAGNGVMLRSKDPNAKQIFGVSVNPKTFPPLAGYGLLVDPDPDARTAPFRGYYVTDTLRQRWPSQITWRSLDAGAANAWGPDYLNRRDLAAKSLDEVRRRVAARRAGTWAAPAGPPAGGGDGATLTFGGMAFPSWGAMWAAAKAESEADATGSEVKLHDGHQKVLTALAAGHRTPKELQAVTGYGRQVYNLLNNLIDAGKVRRVGAPGGQGRYELLEKQAA